VQALPIETIAIVEATAPDVQAKAAAITFRMWHHLPTEEARRLLFAEFILEGEVIGLLEAIAATGRRPWPLSLPRLVSPADAHGASSLRATLEPALMLALTDTLGKLASGAVLNAWRQALRLLTEELSA
jgi:hypothetical protein